MLYFLFLEKEKKHYFLAFLSIVFGLELLLNIIVYKRIGFSWIDFFLVNFVQKLPWKLKSKGIYWSRFALILTPYLTLLPGIYFVKDFVKNKKVRKFLFSSFLLVSLIGFLPATNDRIFFTKILPLLSVFGGLFLKNKKTFPVLLIFFFYNLGFIAGISYPEWSEKIECYIEGNDVCSNFPSLVYLNCGVKARYAEEPVCRNPVFFSLPKLNIEIENSD